jgi:hypothetical protein
LFSIGLKKNPVDAAPVYLAECWTERVYLACVLAGLHLAAQQELSGVTAKDISACSEIYEQL